MNTLIPAVIDQIAKDLYVATISREYGQSGVAALKEVMAALREFFRYVEPEQLKHPLIFCKAFDGDQPVLPQTPDVTALSVDAIANDIAGECVIQIRGSGDLLVWKNASTDLKAISDSAIGSAASKKRS